MTMKRQDNPIDFKRAMEITGNDIKLFESLLEVFLKVKSNYIHDIRTSINNKNAKELEISAHRAKSGLGSLGAINASQYAYEIELMGKKSLFNNIEKIVDIFEKELISVENYAKNKKWE